MTRTLIAPAGSYPPSLAAEQLASIGTLTAPPKLTVGIVTFNAVDVLERALRSVLQHNSPSVEVVIMDGGSTDGTLRILQKYNAQIGLWRSEPDSGIYDAMNKVLQVATGDWLLFLGADDELLASPEQLLGRFTRKDAVYYGNVKIKRTGRISGGKFSRYRLMQENICHQAIFYPRAAYKTKIYDITSGMKADHRYNIELRGSGIPFVHVSETISCFNDQGLSSANDVAFEAIKLMAIRESFGLPLYMIKRARTAAVGLFKRRHVPD